MQNTIFPIGVARNPLVHSPFTTDEVDHAIPHNSNFIVMEATSDDIITETGANKMITEQA